VRTGGAVSQHHVGDVVVVPWADAGGAFLTPGAKVVVTRPALFERAGAV
jgi:hypothetical protein